MAATVQRARLTHSKYQLSSCVRHFLRHKQGELLAELHTLLKPSKWQRTAQTRARSFALLVEKQKQTVRQSATLLVVAMHYE